MDDLPDRAPSHDLAAERAVLGAMMWSERAVDDVTAIISAGDYYRPAHEAIHRAIVRVQSSGSIPDPLTIDKALREAGDWERAGGSTYLYELYQGVPEVGNALYYAQAVLAAADKRRYQVLAEQLRLAVDIDDPEQRAAAYLRVRTGLTDLAATGTAKTSAAIDWDELLSTDFSELDFLTDPLLQAGGQIALVGDGKSGKSLFSLEWAICLANGTPFLGSPPPEPVRVMYIDQENPHPEIKRRLWTLGYGDRRLLSNLNYQSFPMFGPLNTPAGAANLLAEVDRVEPQVIFMDTISRMITGEENSADPWLALYRETLVQLKARGIAVIRLDHFGKDKTRGSRGNSAKSQDVDHVWELTAVPGGRMLVLKRTHSRNGIGPDRLIMQRLGHPTEPGTTAHQLHQQAAAEINKNEAALALARELDQDGIDRKAGRPAVLAHLKAKNGGAAGHRSEVLAEAVRIRKQNPEWIDGDGDVAEGDYGGPDAQMDMQDDAAWSPR